MIYIITSTIVFTYILNRIIIIFHFLTRVLSEKKKFVISNRSMIWQVNWKRRSLRTKVNSRPRYIKLAKSNLHKFDVIAIYYGAVFGHWCNMTSILSHDYFDSLAIARTLFVIFLFFFSFLIDIYTDNVKDCHQVLVKQSTNLVYIKPEFRWIS